MSVVAAPSPRRVASRPRLRAVGGTTQRHTLAYALATVVLLAAAVFGTVTLNALAAAHAVEARALEARVAEGERLYAQLVADVAALEDPARIRGLAQELGLVPSGPARHIMLERNLPADGAVIEAEAPGRAPDPLKPLLSVER